MQAHEGDFAVGLVSRLLPASPRGTETAQADSHPGSPSRDRPCIAGCTQSQRPALSGQAGRLAPAGSNRHDLPGHARRLAVLDCARPRGIGVSAKDSPHDSAAKVGGNRRPKLVANGSARFARRDHARRPVLGRIEVVYNRIRLHSILDQVSPERFEIAHAAWTDVRGQGQDYAGAVNRGGRKR